MAHWLLDLVHVPSWTSRLAKACGDRVHENLRSWVCAPLDRRIGDEYIHDWCSNRDR